jgi:hypothetical protein
LAPTVIPCRREPRNKGKHPIHKPFFCPGSFFFDVQDREHSFGAPHATEYPFVFGNFPKPPGAGDEATAPFPALHLLPRSVNNGILAAVNFYSTSTPCVAAIDCIDFRCFFNVGSVAAA